MTTHGSSALILIPSGSFTPDESLFEAARVWGLDPHRLRLQLKASCLAVLAVGEEARLAPAVEALSRKGLRCALISDQQALALPRLQVAGGVAYEDQALSLRVHGRPAGPPPGVPLLFVFGDIGREVRMEPMSYRREDTFRQRVLRAAFPVVDVVWEAGRVRVPLPGMTWRGLPGVTVSAPDNFLRLFEKLAEQSAGTVLDFGFQGQDVGMDPLRGAEEPLEGADRAKLLLFERYSAAVAIAWKKGIYPPVEPGRLSVAGSLASVEPQRAFGAAPSAAAASPVPWIRRGKRSRVPWRSWSWLFVVPLVALRFGDWRFVAASLTLCGLASLVLGFRALQRRERVRAISPARVRSLAMGTVELSGRIVPCARFVAPYSRVSCAWYRFELQEKQQNARGREQFRTIASGGSSDIPFRLDDGTGSVLVQSAGAEIDVDPQKIELNPQERVLEWLLPEGGKFFIVGFAQRRAPEEDWRRQVSEKLRALKRDPGALARYGIGPDVPDLSDAWERARSEVERQVLKESSARAAERDDVFIGSDPETPFVISSRSRAAETARLTRFFLAGSLMGVAYLVTALLLFVKLL